MSKDKNRFKDRQMKLLKQVSNRGQWGLIINHEYGVPDSKELRALEKQGLITIRRVSSWSVFGPHIRRTIAKSTLGETR